MLRIPDSKLSLGQPLADMLKDFCAANYHAPVVEVVREALQEHIARRLLNREMKERYEHARRKRLGLDPKVVKFADGEPK